MKNIKVIKTNGDYFFTKINGTEDEIIEHYNESNFLGSCDNEEYSQVKQVTIILKGKETGFVGCKQRDIIYNFEYDDKAQCYLY